MTSLQTLSAPAARLFWLGAVLSVSAVTAFVLACATPYPALAALAAGRTRLRDGLLLLGAAWAISQIVGLLLGHSPASMLPWGPILLAGALLSMVVAQAVSSRAGELHALIGTALAYAAAFVAFKLVVFAGGFFVDAHQGAAFTVEVLIRQLVRNGAILAGLVVLHTALIAGGLTLSRPRRAVLV